MRTHTLVARIANAWRAITNPSVTTMEHELAQDRAARDSEEHLPTKRQYASSTDATNGLGWGARRSDRRRARASAQLQAAKAKADAADKSIVDYASSPVVQEVRERAETLRQEHPLHEERLSFRGIHLPKWMRIATEAIIIVADWGVWFSLLVTGMGLSFTKMASSTDPTKVYNPEWFIAHPAEWVTAFVVPTFAAMFTLAVGKLAARRWAQYAAQKQHPERADDLATPVPVWERWGWMAALVVLGAGLWFIAAQAFSAFADELGGLIATPWAVIPLGVFLVERYGQDPIAKVDDLILRSAADVESQKERLTSALMQAEDEWRATWTTYDDMIRELIDRASDDIRLFEQILMRADARSGAGLALAPIADGPLPLVTQSVTEPTVATGQPPRPTPVVLEAQRGLRTEIAPWVTKQIELDLQVLTDCRPPIDGEAERTERITTRFEEAYAAAVAARAGTEKVADGQPVAEEAEHAAPADAQTVTDSPVDETPVPEKPVAEKPVAETPEATAPVPDTVQGLTELGDEEWERLAEEAARP